ncbi:hypothetical protein CSA80_01840 [Candidatus Saccharibacteria bacterium]|nr:MAG: hypothetical protein CSA80_01840 [Candidatus Saccharibacteria bacterium]
MSETVECRQQFDPHMFGLFDPHHEIAPRAYAEALRSQANTGDRGAALGAAACDLRLRDGSRKDREFAVERTSRTLRETLTAYDVVVENRRDESLYMSFTDENGNEKWKIVRDPRYPKRLLTVFGVLAPKNLSGSVAQQLYERPEGQEFAALLGDVGGLDENCRAVHFGVRPYAEVRPEIGDILPLSDVFANPDVYALAGWQELPGPFRMYGPDELYRKRISLHVGMLGQSAKQIGLGDVVLPRP